MNATPNDPLNPNETKQPRAEDVADRECAGKLLGTITPPKRIPVYPGRPDQEGAFAWAYCSRCLRVVQINRVLLGKVLRIINLLEETEHSVEGFDPTKQYILADGCPGCRGGGWSFAIDEFPVTEGKAGASP